MSRYRKVKGPKNVHLATGDRTLCGLGVTKMLMTDAKRTEIVTCTRCDSKK